MREMNELGTNAGSPPNVKIVAGFGGALGLVVVIAAGTIAHLLRRIKTLKAARNQCQRMLLEKPGSRDALYAKVTTPGSAGSGPALTPYQALLSPNSTSTLKASYNHTALQQQHPNKGLLNYLHRASELDATGTTALRPPHMFGQQQPIYEAPSGQR